MTTLPVVRIVSLVPHATELLFALGLGDQVVAVTHECDYPEAADELPKITRDLLPSGLSSAEIDAAVRERTARGSSTASSCSPTRCIPSSSRSPRTPRPAGR